MAEVEVWPSRRRSLAEERTERGGGNMDPSLALLLTLILGFTHTTRAFDRVEYCQGICPKFTRVSANKNYQERLYEESDWMCSKMETPSLPAAMGAHEQLKNFASVKGLTDATWPVLLSEKLVGNRKEYSMCWFLAPGVSVSGQGPVTVMTIPKHTMFVRFLNYRPSFEDGEQIAQQLKKQVEKENPGVRVDQSILYAAGYSSFWSLTQNNEIWLKSEN